MSKKSDRKEAIKKHSKARRELQDYAVTIKDEDAKFAQLNHTVAETEKKVPWWRR